MYACVYVGLKMCSSFISVVVIKFLTKSNMGGKRFYVASNSRLQPTIERKPVQKLEAGHIISTVKSRETRH